MTTTAVAVCCVGALGAGTAWAESIGSDGVGDPYFPQDGNGGYRVSRYDVKVSFDPAAPESFAGDTTVIAKAEQDLDRFNLDLEGFTVSSVLVNGAPAKAVTRSGEHELVITPASRVHRGSSLVVRVRYTGAPMGKSWRRLQGGGVTVSGEPHSATAWFPVDDHPSKKAALHLEATVPSEWSVVGNGLPGPVTTRDGKTTYRWNEDRPIVGYATTMAVDKFTMHTSKLADGTPLIYAYGQNTSILPDAEKAVPDILGFLSSKFGPYPFSSSGAITVLPAAGAGGTIALETQTRPTYAAGSFFDGSAVHELAHQWFGDSVSFSDWRDGCIAECFAQYAGQLWNEYRYGDNLDQAYRTIVSQHKDEAAYWSVHLYDPGKERPLDAALYDRGPLMLHALRRIVGDDTFFATLKAWQAKYRYGNASWLDFEKLAAQQSGKDLAGFFQAWAHSSVIPPEPYLHPGPLKG